MLHSRLIASLAILSCTAAATAQDGGPPDHPPVCNNNGPYLFDANNTPGTTSTDVTLSSNGSFDPDGDPLTFFWFEECSHAFFVDPTSANATLTVDMTGVCTQTCTVALRVTANGVTVHCNTTVTVTDQSAPVFTFCPPDSYIPWTIQNWTQGPDPLVTGTATATDNNDPLPVVTYADQFFTDPKGTGLEGHVIRTWSATDFCGFTSTCTQTIFLLSPSALAFTNFDLMVDSCPNVLDRSVAGNLDMTVLSGGAKNLLTSTLDWSTLTLQRATDGTKQIALASAAFSVGDFGKVTAKFPGQCNSSKKDGKADLRISFDKAALIPALGLDTQAPGSVVELWLTGRDVTGKYYAFRDFVTVQ